MALPPVESRGISPRLQTDKVNAVSGGPGAPTLKGALSKSYKTPGAFVLMGAF